MARLNEQRFQFGLAGLFWLTLVVAVLLGSWRISWWKVAGTVAISTGVLFCLLWIALKVNELRR